MESQPLRQNLVLFKGFSATGKSTLSQALGKRLGWLVVDRDDISDVLVSRMETFGPTSYEIAWSLIRSFMLQGLDVIFCTSLRGKEGISEAKRVTQDLNANLYLVDCTCSDEGIWRKRLETRTHRPAHIIKDWNSFLEFREKVLLDFDYSIDCPRLTIDSVRDLDIITEEVVSWLKGVN